MPNFFFTVLGLCWALARSGSQRTIDRLAATRGRRVLTAVLGVVAALGILVVTQADWAAARAEYEADVAFAEGRSDEALESAARAVTRLNPQRALTGLARLGQAHLREATRRQRQAIDRARRATDTEPPNMRLVMMALADFDASEYHCIEGTHALKELVSRSPGFINTGLIEYRLNMTRAVNAESYVRLAAVHPPDRPDLEKPQVLAAARDQFIKNALRALEREMLRQPYNIVVATEYARAGRGVVDFETILNVLARALRQNRMASSYIDVLGVLLNDPRNDAALTAMAEEARRAITGDVPRDQDGRPVEIWAPERLRIDAMVRFMRGDYAGAAAALDVARRGYEALEHRAALAEASCLAELADARFFLTPLQPQAAIAVAEEARRRAPGGARGGALAEAVSQRLIDYHLAAGNEEQAIAMLQASASGTVGEGRLQSELAARYRRLCESMLTRQSRRNSLPDPVAEGWLVGPPAPPPASSFDPDLLATMQRWIDRALTLHSTDPDVQRVAAAVALERGDVEGAVRHIRTGVENGLSDDVVSLFLEAATTRFPDDPHVKQFAAAWKASHELPADSP